MLRLRDIFVVVVFCLMLRAVFMIALGSTDRIGNDYYIGLFFDAMMYVIMGGSFYWLLRRDALNWFDLLGRNISVLGVLKSIGLAALLVAFTLGENAIEVLLTAQLNPAGAYKYWHFHEERIVVYPFWSIRVMLYVVVSVLLAPLLEEFVFRYLLLRSMSAKMSVLAAVTLGSVFFTALHFSSHYYLSTFIFSLALYFVYLKRKSLFDCVLTHGAFNLFAFLQQNYFDFHWTRPPNAIASVSDWIPQLALFAVSSFILISLLVVHSHSPQQKG